MNCVARIISVKKSILPIISEVSVAYTVSESGIEETYNILNSEIEEYGFKTGAELSEDDFEYFIASAETAKAAIHGIRLLGYSDSSVRMLSQKLRTKGYDRETSIRAAEFLECEGYIKERDTVLRKGDLIAEKKLRGKRRIAEELLSAGYKREYISEWMKTTSVDFAEICARVIEKKGGIPESGDVDGRKKILSYLYRQGFSSDDIRNAIDLM